MPCSWNITQSIERDTPAHGHSTTHYVPEGFEYLSMSHIQKRACEHGRKHYEEHAKYPCQR